MRTVMSRSLRALCQTPLLLLPILAVTAGCSNDDDPSSNPTAPTPTQIIENFTGTVGRNGSTTYAFIANTGAITATLTTVTPEEAVIGMALGEWNATTELCQLRLTNDGAIKGKTLLGSAQVTNNYCVRVSDATGQLTGPVAFDVTIIHF
jgi:hypothetical protein